MIKGLAPIDSGSPVHLHHIRGRNGDKFFVFMEMRERDHVLVHSLTGRVGGLYGP